MLKGAWPCQLGGVATMKGRGQSHTFKRGGVAILKGGQTDGGGLKGVGVACGEVANQKKGGVAAPRAPGCCTRPRCSP